MERMLIFFPPGQNNLCVGLRSAILKLEVLYKFVKFYYSVDLMAQFVSSGKM